MKLNELLRLSTNQIADTKLHLAIGSSSKFRNEPLHKYFDGTFKEWQEWQSQLNFERRYILSLISVRHNEWLYAGLYESISHLPKPNEEGLYRYHTNLTDIGAEFIGRLVVNYTKPFRQSYLRLEKYINELAVVELLREKITARPFEGYEKIHLCFQELSSIINQNIESWKYPLSAVKGVYLLTDIKTGKLYVGSSYGENSFWQRWIEYAKNYHGGNVKLKKVIEQRGPEYANNFYFSILETMRFTADDTELLKREDFWKKVLLTREFGYNDN